MHPPPSRPASLGVVQSTITLLGFIMYEYVRADVPSNSASILSRVDVI